MNLPTEEMRLQREAGRVAIVISALLVGSYRAQDEKESGMSDIFNFPTVFERFNTVR